MADPKYKGWDEQQIGGGRRDEVARYQGIGAEMAKRKAYDPNFDKAKVDEAQGWQAHGNQVEAANGLRMAALGGAPSQAGVLGGQVAGQSLEAQMAASAGGKGLGAAAAQSAAARGMGAQQLGGVGRFTGMAGDEQARANASYGAAGGTMRAGDYAAQKMAAERAEAKAAAEIAQRHLNQGAQMGYEKMGVRGNQAQSNSELEQNKIANSEANTRDAAKDKETSRIGKWVKSGAQFVGSVASWFSDENTKDGVRPLYPAEGEYSAYDRTNQSREDAPNFSHMGRAAMKQRDAGMRDDAKSRRGLHRAMEEGGEGANPFGKPTETARREIHAGRDYEAGPQRAERGTYADRKGKPGDVLGGGGEATYDLGFGKGPSGSRSSNMAPGSEDLATHNSVGMGGGAYGKDGAYADWVSKEIPKDAYSQKIILSDDRTKLAAAWDEGHKAAVADVGKLSKMDAAELKKRSEPAAQAVRDAKAGAWDEGHADDMRPSTPKQQPTATPRRAASTTVGRVDPEAQQHAVQVNETNRNRAAIMGAPGLFGGTAAMASQFMNADVEGSNAGLARRAQGPALLPPTMSDERSKTGKHDKGEMGRALEQGLKPFEYEYKPGFAEHEGQSAHEKNIGPMAQNMAENPITGSAVKKDPGTGLLMIDQAKATKLNSAGLGYLAAKQREQAEEIARLKGGRRGS